MLISSYENEEDVDVLAHELTHAELHTRLYLGKWTSKGAIPVWFDEGVAMQNDYRDKYSEERWNEITDRGTNLRNITLVSDAEFFDSEKQTRIENYILAKHELNSWISSHGTDELMELIDKVNEGSEFKDLYLGN